MNGCVTHGGDPGDVQRRHPGAPTPWIDLSTGINPVPYPLPPLADELWTRLPGRALHDALIEAAARRYGVRDPATLVAAPGTQALIQLLPRLVPPARVAIAGPTYEEHAVSWRRQGHALVERDGDVEVIVNPNNPTGALVEPPPARTLLVVDEAFIDFHPAAASLAPRLPPRTVVLRSFGKAYGLAGVRLGFAIAEPALAARLRDELGPWAVSGPALAIGARALADDGWLQASGARLARDRGRLDALLRAAGFEIVGGTALFCLAAHAQAPAIAEALARAGIHVRQFPHTPAWIRFGIPAAFDRLEAALAPFTTG
jgi:cobalamin biosynthetic protein CobC